MQYWYKQLYCADYKTGTNCYTLQPTILVQTIIHCRLKQRHNLSYNADNNIGANYYIADNNIATNFQI